MSFSTLMNPLWLLRLPFISSYMADFDRSCIRQNSMKFCTRKDVPSVLVNIQSFVGVCSVSSGFSSHFHADPLFINLPPYFSTKADLYLWEDVVSLAFTHSLLFFMLISCVLFMMIFPKSIYCFLEFTNIINRISFKHLNLSCFTCDDYTNICYGNSK